MDYARSVKLTSIQTSKKMDPRYETVDVIRIPQSGLPLEIVTLRLMPTSEFGPPMAAPTNMKGILRMFLTSFGASTKTGGCTQAVTVNSSISATWIRIKNPKIVANKWGLISCTNFPRLLELSCLVVGISTS